MRKLLVSDFDRTLYVNSDISKENIAALDVWKENGNLFAIATGREENILRELLHNYHLTGDYLICNNGARIITWDGRALFEQTMEDEMAWHIVKELSEKYQIPVDVTQKSGRIQVDSKSNDTCAFYKGIRVFKSLKEFEQICHEVLQVHVRFRNMEQARSAADMVKLRCNGAEGFLNRENLDIVCRGIDKAQAIIFLLKAIKWEGEVTAIGDSMNDLCMIEQFDGYTLETADEEVKKRAAHICRDVAECMELLFNKEH